MSKITEILTFSTVQLVRNTDDVKRAASREAVAITEHGKPRYVMMSVEDYQRLNGTANSHRHFTTDETPDFIVDVFGEALGLHRVDVDE